MACSFSVSFFIPSISLRSFSLSSTKMHRTFSLTSRRMFDTKGLMKMQRSLSGNRKQVQSLLNLQGGLNMEPVIQQKDKVVVIMGATGTGKSRLAIDLATHFSAEIINSDKIQVYKGLEICTNKVSEDECRGITHHLLSFVEPDSDFTANNFTLHASQALESIVGRDKLPIIVGGSNSYVEALVSEHSEYRLKYKSCFLWIDVSLTVLHSFVSDRVDKMMEAGAVKEVQKLFDPKADYSRGIRRAIGVQELDQYFRTQGVLDDKTRAKFLQAAIGKIKDNTCALSCRQLQNIHRLYNQWKPNMHRIDATQGFLRQGKEADASWRQLVVGPSIMIVAQFLHNEDRAATIKCVEAAAATTAPTD